VGQKSDTPTIISHVYICSIRVHAITARPPVYVRTSKWRQRSSFPYQIKPMWWAMSQSLHRKMSFLQSWETVCGFAVIFRHASFQLPAIARFEMKAANYGPSFATKSYKTLTIQPSPRRNYYAIKHHDSNSSLSLISYVRSSIWKSIFGSKIQFNR